MRVLPERSNPYPSATSAFSCDLARGQQVTHRDAARLHADLLITPGNDDVGMLEFHQLDRMRDAGRRAAIEALETAPPDLLARLAG